MLKKLLSTVAKHGRRAVEESILRGTNVSKIQTKTTKKVVNYQHKLLQEVSIFQTRWINSAVGNSSRKNLASFIRGNGARQFQSGPATVFSGTFVKRFPLLAFVGIGLSQCNNDELIENAKDATAFCQEIKEIACMNAALNQEIKQDDSYLPGQGVNDYIFGKMISKGCNAAVYEAKRNEGHNVNGNMNQQSQTKEDDGFLMLDLDENNEGSLKRCRSPYNLAIKKMFNLHYESNQPAILRGMEKEALPAKEVIETKKSLLWNFGLPPKKKKRLPHHHNIINIKKVFVDDMIALESSQIEYPDSLPLRLNFRGFGRNQTMYIVMDRYPFTLREYIQKEQLGDTERVMIFAQLLEGILHLHNNKVAHRDLKSDNILINTHPEKTPELIITDFGCCVESLKIPYNTDEVDKGGNFALMAPEIANAVPGENTYLNYSKSDVWAAGTLAYEIFGQENPFYTCWGRQKCRFNSRSYEENELPSLAEWVPGDIQRIVSKMLKKNPNQRPKPRLVADALQLLLWAPKEWFTDAGKQEIGKNDVLEWLQVMFVDYILGNKDTVEYKLKAMFLSRLDLNHVMAALRFLHN